MWNWITQWTVSAVRWYPCSGLIPKIKQQKTKQKTKQNKTKNRSISAFCVFRPHWLILVQSRWVGLTVCIYFIAFFLCFFSGRLCSRILLGLTLSSRHWNSHLHCCYPQTTIICCSESMLFKGQGYLSLTRLPVKIGVASGNEDNQRCIQSVDMGDFSSNSEQGDFFINLHPHPHTPTHTAARRCSEMSATSLLVMLYALRLC